ncbi:hypothetical protein CMQ_6339 [Grosmannia clavigera kw1407]|uniref:Altered inheritance of mitochondria protein 41 n=1 Tax=Grosmannia clavigera (strain kw1407 / UAMH 11150) TaxID=655863 RepID=F0XLF9_GROCL|nr:uncharacterized protein CMQ_6339 [Grosmannia clavigera kw1407]EFX01397.1 hypothetical protein CMQ_6339 [Grosmannia clavigera kw1407]
MSAARSLATGRFAAARLFPRTSPVAVRGCLFCRPYSSSDAPPPPMLARLKGDLKAAMKAKDAARLAVLRSVLAATLNASKTAQPISTDAQLVALLRRTARASQDAAAEFRSANRADLADKEDAQIAILESYARESGIESVGPEQVQAAAEAVLAGLQAELAAGTGKTTTAAGKGLASEVMRRLLAPDGPLDGKDVDKKDVAVTVKRLTAQA